jgi:hypothetical protein
MATVVVTTSMMEMFVFTEGAIADEIYVTEGYSNSDGISVNDNLGIGRTWAVYDLKDRQYLGDASVSSVEMRDSGYCYYNSSRNGYTPEATLNRSFEDLFLLHRI